MSVRSFSLTRRLESLSRNWIAVYLGFTACLTFILVYGFLKAWTVSSWSNVRSIYGVESKTWMLIVHTVGYASGKLASLILISSISPAYRFRTLLTLPLISAYFWLLFGFSGSNPILLVLSVFGSAFFLAPCWSLLYLYVEGRNQSDILGAVLSSSYIVGSGIARCFGQLILDHLDNDESWMPILTCGVYALPFLISALLVSWTPVPSLEEKRENSNRQPMSGRAKAQFLKRYWPGIVAMTLSFMIWTAIRDIRGCFQAELWQELHPELQGQVDSSVFVLTEVPVTLAVLLALCCLNVMRDHRMSMVMQHALLCFGNTAMFVTQLLFQLRLISGATWFTLIGMSVYLCYTPITAMYYDRLVGALRLDGTATFMIDLSDCCGYFGTVVIMTLKACCELDDDAVVQTTDIGPFMNTLIFVGSLVSGTLVVVSSIFWYGQCHDQLKPVLDDDDLRSPMYLSSGVYRHHHPTT